jgi:hypothetical protein
VALLWVSLGIYLGVFPYGSFSSGYFFGSASVCLVRATVVVLSVHFC